MLRPAALACLALSLSAASATSVAAPAPRTVLRGQVVCSVCWSEEDRAKVAYGSKADLECAARCAKRGVPMALAVREGEEVSLYLLREGAFQPGKGGFLPYVGMEAEVEGEVQERPGKEPYLVAASFRATRRGGDEAATLPSPAPPLSAKDLSGSPRTLAALRGKTVVVSFWATWCAPCREEMPMLSALQKELGPKGVVVLGVSVNGDRAEVKTFASARRLGYETWYDGSAAQMKAFGLGTALPASAVVDAEGRLVARFPGLATREELLSAIEAAGASTKAAASAAGR